MSSSTQHLMYLWLYYSSTSWPRKWLLLSFLVCIMWRKWTNSHRTNGLQSAILRYTLTYIMYMTQSETIHLTFHSMTFHSTKHFKFSLKIQFHQIVVTSNMIYCPKVSMGNLIVELHVTSYHFCPHSTMCEFAIEIMFYHWFIHASHKCLWSLLWFTLFSANTNPFIWYSHEFFPSVWYICPQPHGIHRSFCFRTTSSTL